MTIRPDPTFHATAKLAMEAPAERYAYCLMLSPDFSQPDALEVVDLDPKSSRQYRSHRDHAEQRRRISPFWLERLFVGVVSAFWPRLPGTALLDHSWHPVVANIRDRHKARSHRGKDP